MQLSRRRTLWPAHAYARRPKCHFKHSRQVYLSRSRRDHDAEIAQRQGNPPVCTRSVAHGPSFTFEDPEEHKETQWPNGSLKSSVWALYQALKAFGQVPKSLFILQVIDDPVLRQAIEKQLDRIEHAHRFTRAVSVGNPREFLQAEKEEQEMAEACKRLIKNCIICWNYLYLSQKLENSEDTAIREAFLEAVANGSAVSWQHINLLGEYDFSDEKLQDTVGIKPQKLADQRETFLGPAKRTELPGRNGLR